MNSRSMNLVQLSVPSLLPRLGFAQLNSTGCHALSWPEMREKIEVAASDARWLIFAGHEIGPGGGQTTSDETLTQLADFVSDPQKGLHCDSVTNIARYVAGRRGSSESQRPSR